MNPELEKRKKIYEYALKGFRGQLSDLAKQLEAYELQMKELKTKKDETWKEISVLEEAIRDTEKRLQELGQSKPELLISPQQPVTPPSVSERPKMLLNWHIHKPIGKMDKHNIYQEILDAIVAVVKYSEGFGITWLAKQLDDKCSIAVVNAHVHWMQQNGRLLRNEAISGPKVKWRLPDDQRVKVPEHNGETEEERRRRIQEARELSV